MSSVRILTGDARDTLKRLPDESIHCVITSPPYWSLRAYEGEPGMIGMEPTFEKHLENLMQVFSEVRRVLRPDGTLWLNYGDAYAGGGRGDGSVGSKQRTNAGSLVPPHRGWTADHYKPKDLMLMPARVAMALQAEGWWLRSEIIWSKLNPMPESVKDRPTSAHEKLYLLTKRPRYFYDHVAVRSPWKRSSLDRLSQPTFDRQQGGPKDPKSGNRSHRKVLENLKRRHRKKDKQRGHGRRHDGFNDRWDNMTKSEQQAMGAQLRNVWSIATYPYKGSHFAVFPPSLVEPCIRSGTSEKGVCKECGLPLVREISVSYRKHRPSGGLKSRNSRGNKSAPETNWGTFGTNLRKQTRTTGWKLNCSCESDVTPATVLDPFAGADTVGLVASRLGRDSILCEISPKYAEMSARRIKKVNRLFVRVRVE